MTRDSMKFYYTILIAIVLFGLCLIERKAKQDSMLKGTTPNESFSIKTERNMPEIGKESFQNSTLVSNSSDSLVNQTFSPQKAMLNVSFSAPLLSTQ